MQILQYNCFLSKAAMFILLMEWLLIMFAIYEKHMAELR